MHYTVSAWTRKPEGPDIAPGAIAFAAELDCGHVYEAHGYEGQYALLTVVVCGVCAQYADWAAELDASQSAAPPEPRIAAG